MPGASRTVAWRRKFILLRRQNIERNNTQNGRFLAGKGPPNPNPVIDMIILDDKFTPTKHLTPPPHHSSRPAAAHTDTETPAPLHQKEG